MRRVVGGDRVERTVLQAFDDRLNVSGGSERRIHSEVRVSAHERLLGQGEVMRRGFGGDLHTSALCVAYQRHACPGADVTDVHRHVVRRCQRDLARSAAVLGCRRDALHTERFTDSALVDLAAFGKG